MPDEPRADADYDGGPLPAGESRADFAGSPDGFQRLWTPHRIAYVEAGQDAGDGCVFCEAPQRSDEDALIVHRGELAYAILNLYPYNAGHLLVVPYRHIATYDLASDAEVAEIGRITQTAMRVIQQTSRCHGFNIGMNQGQVAGAGISQHLHQHVVPRWAADANFMPIVAQTKTVPILLGETRATLAAAWPTA